MIYEPAEDSYLLQEQVKIFVKTNMAVLDVGTGSGIQAVTAKKQGANVLAVDINPKCVEFTREQGVEAITSDLFSNVKEKFDIIIFNPPYLPEEPLEPKDSALSTTGGKKGNEVLARFLAEAKDYLKEDGKVLIVFSSLTPDVDQLIEECGFTFEKISEQKIDFETLYVYLIEIAS
ncbi:methyltransferase [archaeon]|jgi:release factor glutamine methyltransferase|nr:methyltransferase [archaeon]